MLFDLALWLNILKKESSTEFGTSFFLFVLLYFLVLSDSYVSSDEETTTNPVQKVESEIPELVLCFFVKYNSRSCFKNGEFSLLDGALISVFLSVSAFIPNVVSI